MGWRNNFNSWRCDQNHAFQIGKGVLLPGTKLFRYIILFYILLCHMRDVMLWLCCMMLCYFMLYYMMIIYINIYMLWNMLYSCHFWTLLNADEKRRVICIPSSDARSFPRFASKTRWALYWLVVSNIFYFHSYLGKISNLTNIFQMDWNYQPV